MPRQSFVEPAYTAHPSFREALDLGLMVEEGLVGAYGDLGYFRASSMGYCLRRQMYDRAGFTHVRKAKIQDKRTLALGNVYHSWLQRRAMLSGLLIEEEMTLVDPDLGVSGHVDMVWGGKIQPLTEEQESKWSDRYQNFVREYRSTLEFKWPEGVPVRAVEFKSANDYSIEKMYSEGPSFAHKHQVGTYWSIRDSLLKSERTPASDKDFYLSIEEWGLFIAGKSEMKIIEFDLRRDQADLTRERIDMLLHFWETAVLPPCTCGMDISWEGRYCAYRDGGSDSSPICCSPFLFEQIDWDDIREREVKQREERLAQMAATS